MAATVIDALLVTLGLDTTGFKKGQAEADEALKKTKDNTVQNAKEITAKAKQATDGFVGMRKELLKIVGIFVSANGIKSFVERITTSDAAVGRLSDNLGIATSELSAWQKMSEKFGGSSEDTDSLFRNIYKISQELKLFGSSSALQPLGRLLGPEGLARFADNATTIAEKAKILQAAVAGASSRQDALSLMQQAGFTEQTVTVMREIGRDLETQLSLQRQLNVAGKEDAKLAQERAAAWNRLADALERVGRAIVNSPLLNMTDGLNKIAGTVQKWTNDPSTIFQDIWSAPEKIDMVGGVKKVFGWMDDGISNVVRGWLKANPPASKQGSRKVSGKVGVAPAADAGDVGAAPGGSLQYGSAAFADQFERDLRSGAEFGGSALARLTGSRAAASLANRASAVRPSGASQKVDISIGSMQVNTQATDARGIARDIGGALRANYSLATQANTGTD